MRFSLKWILAAVVYVAVAAAAFSQASWVYADILWAVSLLAIVWATLMMFLTRGRARAAAAGFLLASGAFLLCVAAGLLLGGNVVPTSRILVAAGYQQFQPSPFYYVQPPMPYQPSNPTNATFTPVAPAYPTPVATAQIAAVPATAPTYVDFAQYVRAGNAVGMMLFGALGVLMGFLAWRLVSRGQ
jgi:hypothetical protein